MIKVDGLGLGGAVFTKHLYHVGWVDVHSQVRHKRVDIFELQIAVMIGIAVVHSFCKIKIRDSAHFSLNQFAEQTFLANFK